MKFLTRKRHTAPAVIIVALIDVLVVLVIFLLVTTTFKQFPSMKLTLPESTAALKPGGNENPWFVVTIGTNAIAPFRLGANDLPVTSDQLDERLRAEVGKNPKLRLAVRADKNAAWQSVVKVMDAARAANIKTISAETKKPGER
jgi:biopolymer transport protein ExbD